MTTSNETFLEIKNLQKYFPVRKGILLRKVNDVKAVDGISFTLKRGQTLALVGESGCGKSTLGKSIIRLHEPTAGEITFKGDSFSQLSGSELREKRKSIQMIFQDPFASLDPRMTVGQILMEPLKIHNIGSEKEQEEKARAILSTVGLKEEHINRYPHEFSGGQRQRISIARTIMLKPELIIADEPTSALDVSIQAQILNLLKDLQEQLNLTYIFISHDLSVVEHFCDFVAVMYLGKIVEMAPRDELFANPQHPYTQALLEAIPRVGRGKRRHRQALSGDVPSPINPPSGCTFHPRCKFSKKSCEQNIPSLITSDTDNNSSNTQHLVSCTKVNQTDKYNS